MHQAELQKLFGELGIHPNRKLGQSFLIDDHIARWIVEQLQLTPDDVVVEAGPGAGALTRHLAGQVRRLIVIEKDAKLAAWLKEHYAEKGQAVEVVHGDAVEFDIRPLFREGTVKLIGNLPYSAGTEILRNFLTPPTPVERAVVMLQREVAGRICAVPRSKAYSVLSLMLQAFWLPHLLKTIGPGPFFPQPEVESAVMRFDPRTPGDLPMFSPQVFEQIVRRGFSQRRKQLHNNLQIPKKEWIGLAQKIGAGETARAEELSLEQWIELANEIDPRPTPQSAQRADEIFDVVDQDDVVTGQATRAEVHRENLLHRAIHVFLFNRKGEIYLQKRSCLKDSHAGKWDSSASGHLDSGESYDDAAVRELDEELGVHPREPLELLGKLDAGPATDWEFVQLYRGECRGRIRTHGSEIECGGFFSLEEVAGWVEGRPHDFAPAFVELFRRFAIDGVTGGGET